MVADMKEVCRRFQSVTGMRAEVQTRAGKANKQMANSESLRSKKCGRDERLVCKTRGGRCEKNEAGYEIRCETCLRAGRSSKYKGETETNFFSLENIIKMPSGWKIRKIYYGSTVS